MENLRYSKNRGCCFSLCFVCSSSSISRQFTLFFPCQFSFVSLHKTETKIVFHQALAFCLYYRIEKERNEFTPPVNRCPLLFLVFQGIQNRPSGYASLPPFSAAQTLINEHRGATTLFEMPFFSLRSLSCFRVRFSRLVGGVLICLGRATITARRFVAIFLFRIEFVNMLCIARLKIFS